MNCKRIITKKIVLFVFILNLISCTQGTSETNTELIIENNSGFSLQYKVYSNGTIIDLQTIQNNNKKKYRYTDKDDMGINFFPFSSADSVIVIYDNTYQITHYKNNGSQSGSQKTILDLNNWIKFNNENRNYKYKYIFTADDYSIAN